MKIAKRLQEMRKNCELTQKELAKAINYSQSQISQWENGINEPTATAIVVLCDYFNVCADYLLGRQDWY